MMPSEITLLEMAIDKSRQAKNIIDDIKGNRELFKKRYISAKRLSELEGLLKDIYQCVDTLHHNEYRAMSKINRLKSEIH